MSHRVCTSTRCVGRGSFIHITGAWIRGPEGVVGGLGLPAVLGCDGSAALLRGGQECIGAACPLRIPCVLHVWLIRVERIDHPPQAADGIQPHEQVRRAPRAHLSMVPWALWILRGCIGKAVPAVQGRPTTIRFQEGVVVMLTRSIISLVIVGPVAGSRTQLGV